MNENEKLLPVQQSNILPGMNAWADRWAVCKKELKASMPEPFFDTFIRPIEAGQRSPLNESGEPYVLVLPDERLRRHVEDRYIPEIRRKFSSNNFCGQISLRTAVAAKDAAALAHKAGIIQKKSEYNTPDSSLTLSQTPSGRSQMPSGSETLPNGLREPDAYFADSRNQYVQNRFERLEYSGSTAIVTGPSGCGKTTFLKALALEKSKKGTAHYCTLETFLTDFSQACRDRETIAWRRQIRSYELLIIDDFQFLKPTARKTQEELRHLIDDFEERGFRLILSMDMNLSGLRLQTDLSSRLRIAETLNLAWPNFSMRKSILSREMKRRCMDGETYLVERLAARIQGDGRKLIAAVQRIDLEHRRNGGESFSPEDYDRLLEEYYSVEEKAGPQDILRLTAEYFRVSVDEIRGPARDKKYTLPRHVAAYLCTEILAMNLISTARAIGRKDHASAIHARKKVEKMFAEDLFFRGQILELKRRIRDELARSVD